MEPDQKYAAVGLFVVLCVVGFIAMGMWLGGTLEQRNNTCYLMRFDGSVAGLSQGSTITFRGVSVGKVEAIRINPQNDTQILVRAALDKRTPVKANTVARLKPQGITGASYIELDLQEGITGSNQPTQNESCFTIATVPSGIDQIVNILPQILDKALVVTDRLSVLLGEGNSNNISATLANLNGLTAELRDATGTIGPQLERATTELNSAMANLNKLTGSLNEGGAGAQELQDTVRQTRAAIAEVKSLAEEIRTNPQRALNPPTVKEEKVP